VLDAGSYCHVAEHLGDGVIEIGLERSHRLGGDEHHVRIGLALRASQHCDHLPGGRFYPSGEFPGGVKGLGHVVYSLRR
jgi:hypothetical protein